MSDEIRITLMRHGRSLADDENVIEGRYDSPLTEVGREQAVKRGRELKESGIVYDAIIASTLVRASETASIVGQILGLEVEPDADWMEKDNGPVAGMAFEEARKKYPVPDFHNPFEPHVVSANAGESNWAFYCRAAGALEKVIRRGPGQYLVVAHGGILNAALWCVCGTQPSPTGQGLSFSLGDTGYIRARYAPRSHRWNIYELKPGA